MPGGDFNVSTGVSPNMMRPAYKTYQSPYGPKYTVGRNYRGWNLTALSRIGMTLAGFGSAAGLAAIFMASDVPRVRKDIMMKIPIIGEYFIRDIPPSDNMACLLIRSIVIRVGQVLGLTIVAGSDVPIC